MAAATTLSESPGAHNARHDVLVRRDGRWWVISGAKRAATLEEDSLRVTIESEGLRWVAEQPADHDLVLESAGRRVGVSLAGAARREISPYETGARRGVRIALEGWSAAGVDSSADGLRIELFLCMETPDEELVAEVVVSRERTHVAELTWPGSFTPESFDHTVVPFMQGMLLPKGWPDEVRLYDSMSYGRGLYMPWWGFLQGDTGMLVLLETPADGGCRLLHPAGGPTLIHPVWHSSLGRLRYPRRLRIAPVRGGYVALAKRYRRHVVASGKLVTLAEKAARNPLAARLVGTPVVHTSILYHIQPESSYYKPNEPANHQLVTFADRARHLEALAAAGVERAYVHLDGWGFRGYDNLHPDILPPCPEAGGWEGMKLFADTCDRLGWIFAVHDQYRDYYHDAASYSDRHTILDGHGQRPFESTWYGGHQSILCARLAPEHVARNHGEIHRRGVKLRGAYLDVFAVVPGDECHSPEHPVTRKECLEYRGRCFDTIRSFGGVVSSEEPADWAVPHLDLVHHGPHALRPNPGAGPAMGIPVPLFSLVYHDALIVPWGVSLDRGGWGIPDGDHGYLYGLLHAGVPYLSLTPSPRELEIVRTLCALHERVGRLEMTSHEALDPGRRRQRSTFADGTTVEVDFDAGTHSVTPRLA
jgi:hypothetical protein